jgi:hypothetical protein
MSKQELVDAYLDGSLNRRGFVRRLIATGVSAGAATGYAQLLAPSAEAAQTPRPNKRRAGSDLYPRIVVRITTRDLQDVRKNQRLKIKVTSSVSGFAHVSAYLDKGGHLQSLGYTPYAPESARSLTAGQTKTITIPFSATSGPGAHSKAGGPLAGLDKAKVQVELFVDNHLLNQGFAKATLK